VAKSSEKAPSECIPIRPSRCALPYVHALRERAALTPPPKDGRFLRPAKNSYRVLQPTRTGITLRSGPAQLRATA
jgi:hypothetical protein